MPALEKVNLSRRRLLALGALGGSAILVVQPRAAQAAVEVAADETAPLPPAAERALGRGLTDLAGIHAEYRDAVSTFPLPLPGGVAFPAESGLTDVTPAGASDDSTVLWQRGNGIAEVYLYWQTAVATAAWLAMSRGDTTTAAQLLDNLEAGYNSDYRRAIVDDPTDVFIAEQLTPARRGDYEPIRLGLGF